MSKNNRCANCKFAGMQFKVINRFVPTHLHCEHPRYTEEDYKNGKFSAWDTLRIFYENCKDFKQKIKRNEHTKTPKNLVANKEN